MLLVKDDHYISRLDVMSCCKSDYNLYHRTKAGWLVNTQRFVLETSDLNATELYQLMLWPFDRSESRGEMVSIGIRRKDDEMILLGFRSASHWQDNVDFSPKDMEDNCRENVQGITAEYIRRENGGLWPNSSAIIDFNQLLGDWPSELPQSAGLPPKSGSFVALKQGSAWYEPESRLLFLVERFQACPYYKDALEENELFYKVNDFYGYRGEWPGQEEFIKLNFSGYKTLPCATVRIQTNAPRPTGRIPATIAIHRAGDKWKRNNVQGGFSSSETSSYQSILNSCPENTRSDKLEVLLTVSWPQNIEVISTIWQNKLNQTIENRIKKSIQITIDQFPVRVRLLSADGRQNYLTVSAHSEAKFRVLQKHYLHDKFEFEESILHMQNSSQTLNNEINLDCETFQARFMSDGRSEGQATPYSLTVILASIAVFPMSGLIALIIWVSKRKAKMIPSYHI